MLDRGCFTKVLVVKLQLQALLSRPWMGSGKTHNNTGVCDTSATSWVTAQHHKGTCIGKDGEVWQAPCK